MILFPTSSIVSLDTCNGLLETLDGKAETVVDSEKRMANSWKMEGLHGNDGGDNSTDTSESLDEDGEYHGEDDNICR